MVFLADRLADITDGAICNDLSSWLNFLSAENKTVTRLWSEENLLLLHLPKLFVPLLKIYLKLASISKEVSISDFRAREEYRKRLWKGVSYTIIRNYTKQILTALRFVWSIIWFFTTSAGPKDSSLPLPRCVFYDESSCLSNNHRHHYLVLIPPLWQINLMCK